MIHDVAIAIRKMQKLGRIRGAMTVDCDVHQGNGTAAIFPPKRQKSRPLPSISGAQVASRPTTEEVSHDDASVFTISLHQENNYPAYKPPSSIDVDLPDGIGDDDYLAWLDNALSSGLRQFDPELICYIAGADPYREPGQPAGGNAGSGARRHLSHGLRHGNIAARIFERFARPIVIQITQLGSACS